MRILTRAKLPWGFWQGPNYHEDSARVKLPWGFWQGSNYWGFWQGSNYHEYSGRPTTTRILTRAKLPWGFWQGSNYHEDSDKGQTIMRILTRVKLPWGFWQGSNYHEDSDKGQTTMRILRRVKLPWGFWQGSNYHEGSDKGQTTMGILITLKIWAMTRESTGLTLTWKVKENLEASGQWKSGNLIYFSGKSVNFFFKCWLSWNYNMSWFSSEKCWDYHAPAGRPRLGKTSCKMSKIVRGICVLLMEKVWKSPGTFFQIFGGNPGLAIHGMLTRYQLLRHCW